MDIQSNRPIALFDSGVGGISVLSEMIRLMPGESYLYFGDSANAPYGSRSAAEVRALTEKHAAFLLEQGAKAIVVACNTATGAAIAGLREKYPDLPIIGMEPAIKPAALAHPGGRILVMATPVTLTSEKFRHLMSLYTETAEIIPVPCKQLARMIEAGILEGPQLEEYLQETLAPHLFRPADAVVLGCTHYPFIRSVIARMAGTNHIYDGGAGTARETQRRLREQNLLSDGNSEGMVTILNSEKDEERIRFCHQLLANITNQNNL